MAKPKNAFVEAAEALEDVRALVERGAQAQEILRQAEGQWRNAISQVESMTKDQGVAVASVARAFEAFDDAMGKIVRDLQQTLRGTREGLKETVAGLTLKLDQELKSLGGRIEEALSTLEARHARGATEIQAAIVELRRDIMESTRSVDAALAQIAESMSQLVHVLGRMEARQKKHSNGLIVVAILCAAAIALLGYLVMPAVG